MGTLFKQHNELLQHVLQGEAAQINAEVVEVNFKKS
jgi:hypothetical protein